MTKRRDILKTIKAAAKERGVSFEVSEGGKHSIVILDGAKFPVPRHTEIGEGLTRTIYSQCALKLGEDWWS